MADHELPDGKAVEGRPEDMTGWVCVPHDASEAKKRLLRKCDRYVLPPCTVLFFLAFMYRTNIGSLRFSTLRKTAVPGLEGVRTDVTIAPFSCCQLTAACVLTYTFCRQRENTGYDRRP